MRVLKIFAVNKGDLQLTRLHPRLTKLIACLKRTNKHMDTNEWPKKNIDMHII